jgi:hypothetical protein
MIVLLVVAVVVFVALLLAASGVDALVIVGALAVAVAAVAVPVTMSARKLGSEREQPPEVASAQQAPERTRFTVQQGRSIRKDDDWFQYEFTITPTGPGNARRVRALLVFADTDETVTGERVDVSERLRAREPRSVRFRVPSSLHEHPERIGRAIMVRVEWVDGGGARNEIFGPPIEVGGTGIRRR